MKPELLNDKQLLTKAMRILDDHTNKPLERLENLAMLVKLSKQGELA